MMSQSFLLPSQHIIDYPALLASEENGPIIPFLQSQLPMKWRETYLSTVTHEANLVSFQVGTFEYLCDLYSALEAQGGICFNQTIKDRVIAAMGISCTVADPRRASRVRNWVAPAEYPHYDDRDAGHFIARSLGGGLYANVFWQKRQLNRGWSARGKTFRQMETYCRRHPGTFCFSRPIYADGSDVPRWLEFGVLKEDQMLWVEVFEN
jgi:hypothetical protein